MGLRRSIHRFFEVYVVLVVVGAVAAAVFFTDLTVSASEFGVSVALAIAGLLVLGIAVLVAVQFGRR